jgi:hypothetical protein
MAAFLEILATDWDFRLSATPSNDDNMQEGVVLFATKRRIPTPCYVLSILKISPRIEAFHNFLYN